MEKQKILTMGRKKTLLFTHKTSLLQTSFSLVQNNQVVVLLPHISALWMKLENQFQTTYYYTTTQTNVSNNLLLFTNDACENMKGYLKRSKTDESKSTTTSLFQSHILTLSWSTVCLCSPTRRNATHSFHDCHWNVCIEDN